MSFSFRCKICGNTHEGLPSFGPDAPFSYEGLDEKQRPDRAVIGSDSCIIDDEWFFIRGRLELPVLDLKERFVWLVWCSLSMASYDEWVRTFDLEERAHIGPFFGWLNSALPFYEDTLDLATSVHLVNYGQRPLITIHETDHDLYFDQTHGIAVSKAERFVQDLLHGA